MTLTVTPTLLQSETIELERNLLARSLDILRLLRAGEIVPTEATTQLFAGTNICELGDQGVGKDVIAFLEQGFFLEDVEHFIGTQQLQNTIADMEAQAVKLLAKRSPKGYCPWMLAKKESFARRVAAISLVLPRAATT